MRIFGFIAIVLLTTFTGIAQDGKLTITWKFDNVVEGYDHLNKIDVYIDGDLKASSESFYETKLGTLELSVPTGKHSISITNFAYYEGNWEAHTLENDYSIEATYYESHNFSSKNNLNIVWDINGTGTDATAASWKKTKSKTTSSAKNVTLSVTWKFTNVNEGYDHDTRIKVYVDGKLYYTSPKSLGSKGGKFTCTVPMAKSDIRIVSEAFYEGNWEEHTRVNNYSVDAEVNKSSGFKSKMSLNVEFDIDTEESKANWK